MGVLRNKPQPRTQKLVNALVLEFQKTEARRVTDREVAAYLKIRPGTLSKWRNGGTQLEQVEWLLRLLEGVPEDRWLREVRDALVSASKAHRKISGK